jgi:hypothetical protein
MASVSDNAPQSVPWPDVAAALSPARNYWLNTISPDGSPHASPVWGVVVSGRFHFYTARTSRKARNLARDNRAAVHLESAQDVVIVYGRVEDLGEPNLTVEVTAALSAKYIESGDADYLPKNDESFDALFRLRPAKALLWHLTDFESSQRRWSNFESS